MTHKIGTRVKKVRGAYNVDSTGIVVDHNPSVLEFWRRRGFSVDIAVRHDCSWISVFNGTTQPAGSKCVTDSAEWEPILPEGSAPSEFSYWELMDNLRETVNV